MGLFLFQEQEPFFVCPGMEAGQARSAGWEHGIIGYGDHEDPWELIKAELTKRNVPLDSIAVEKDSISFPLRTAQTSFRGAAFVSAEETLNQFRLVKDEKEISILREAAKLADYGVEVGVAALKEGVSETEVLAQIEFELKKKVCRACHFQRWCCSGKIRPAPWESGCRQVEKGDFVLFDLGVILDGYCSDITRTFAYQSISPKQEEIYETVLKAEQAALQLSKPGVRIGDLDLKARGIIEKAGYGDYFPHRLGHGLGISVHEYPSMSSANDTLLKEGMVYTIEPGIYVPDVGGVRIEDDVFVTKTAPKH